MVCPTAGRTIKISQVPQFQRRPAYLPSHNSKLDSTPVALLSIHPVRSLENTGKHISSSYCVVKPLWHDSLVVSLSKHRGREKKIIELTLSAANMASLSLNSGKTWPSQRERSENTIGGHPQTFLSWQKCSLLTLTLYFHNLIGVLNHLVLGFITEGMRPGLNQVQNLVSHIWLGLLLKQKEWQVLLLLSTWQITTALSHPIPTPHPNTPEKKKAQSQGYDVIRKWIPALAQRGLSHMMKLVSNQILLAHAVQERVCWRKGRTWEVPV